MGETVLCKFCEEPTRMLSTKMCDGCWEVDMRLDRFVESKAGRVRVLDALLTSVERKDPEYLRKLSEAIEEPTIGELMTVSDFIDWLNTID